VAPPDEDPAIVPELLTGLGLLSHPRAAALHTAVGLAELARHAWPGNVRELRNYLEAIVLFPKGVPEQPDESRAGEGVVPERVTPAFDLPYASARTRWLHEFERSYLIEALRRHDGEVSAASRAVGLDRVYMHRLLRKHGLR